jgi:hypothetical protein
VSLIISSKKRRLERTKRLLDIDQQYRVLTAWKAWRDVKHSVRLRHTRLLHKVSRALAWRVLDAWQQKTARAFSLRVRQLRLESLLHPRKLRLALSAWKDEFLITKNSRSIKLKENKLACVFSRDILDQAFDEWWQVCKTALIYV